jgi:hypothetical protein
MRAADSLSGPTCVVVCYGYALADPPVVQAAASFAQGGWRVVVIQGAPADGVVAPAPPGVEVVLWPSSAFPRWPKPLRQVARLLVFRRTVARALQARRPDVVVTIMLRALMAVPSRRRWRQGRLFSCIYDIPSPRDTGRVDRVAFWEGWRRLRGADLVWASDAQKARLASHVAKLARPVVVVHNCPVAGGLPGDPRPARDPWLRHVLSRQGALLSERGMIVLRAGAIGPLGGIEETLEAMEGLEDVVFVMMGRPTVEYAEALQRLVRDRDLGQRAFLWERPERETWERALSGADVGHLVHGPYSGGRNARLAQLNSVLSANRLFQYMKAGLAIVVHEDERLEALRKEAPCFVFVRHTHLVFDLRSSLDRLSKQPEERAELARAGWEAHVRKYNWSYQFEPVMRRARLPATANGRADQ